MRNLETLISKLGEFIVKNIEESSKKDPEDRELDKEVRQQVRGKIDNRDWLKSIQFL